VGKENFSTGNGDHTLDSSSRILFSSFWKELEGVGCWDDVLSDNLNLHIVYFAIIVKIFS
jgi:hypothetical protein